MFYFYVRFPDCENFLCVVAVRGKCSLIYSPSVIFALSLSYLVIVEVEGGNSPCMPMTWPCDLIPGTLQTVLTRSTSRLLTVVVVSALDELSCPSLR